MDSRTNSWHPSTATSDSSRQPQQSVLHKIMQPVLQAKMQMQLQVDLPVKVSRVSAEAAVMQAAVPGHQGRSGQRLGIMLPLVRERLAILHRQQMA